MLSLNKNWSALIKPSKILYDVLDKNNNIAKIIVEPLERGFGFTIGNAMRRIMLSSLQGAAITAIRIPGIVHEFSAIPGVKEDLVDIILNVKSIVIKMHSLEKKTLRLTAKGPCIVTAGMIKTDHDVQVLTPDTVICVLAKDVHLDI